MVTRVGLIGVGHMGGALAANVIKAGFDVMVYDARKEPMEELARLGAKVARSPAEIGEHAEVIQVAVNDDAQVEQVLLGEDGVLTTAKPGTVVALHSTIHPRTVKKAAKEAEKQGVVVIDANMSGGRDTIEAQKLVFMVGGDSAHLEKCRPVFEASGKQIFHMGDLGTAAAAKLAQQVTIVGIIIATAEGMLLAKKAGVRREALAEVFHASGGVSQTAAFAVNHVPSLGKWAADGFYKGLVPAIDLAHELEVTLPNLAVSHQLLSLHLPLDQ